MSWLSQFVKHNRDFAGNALKNIAPLSFLIPGVGPLAAAGLGAAGSALGRGIQHGSNLGNILKQGAEGGAMAYGGAQGMNALKAAFTPGSSAAGTVAQSMPGMSVTPSATAPMAIQGPGSAALNMTQGLGQAPSLMSRVGSAANGLGSFVKNNPTAAAMGLQGLGQMGSMGSENAYRNAQTDALKQNTNLSKEQYDQQLRRQAAMEPLLRALMGNVQGMSQPGAVAPNPYLHG